MGRSVAGLEVDASYLRRIVEERVRRHGDKFDASDLEAAAHFAPYLHNGLRLKVRTGNYERTGTVGITTGWKPAFLLMHRSSDHGSSDVLGSDDIIVASWTGRCYESLLTANP